MPLAVKLGLAASGFYLLIAGEIGGLAVILRGFLRTQFFTT